MHESTTEPPNPTPRGQGFRLARALRGLVRKRIALCSTVRVAPDVTFAERLDSDGVCSLVVRGVGTCGSVHSCPRCAPAILTERAETIADAVKLWGHKRTAMVTLTLRHELFSDLYVLQRVLAESYSRMKNGRAGIAFRLAVSHACDVRGAEQTHGAHGWHPHLHALWFLGGSKYVSRLRRIITREWQRAVRQTHRAMRKAGQKHEAGTLSKERERALFGVRGCAAVLAALPELEAIMPDEEHGAHVADCSEHGANYISKLGLEVAAVFSKSASERGRTSWQIANDAGTRPDPTDRAAVRRWRYSRALWAEHCRDMKGRRQLTWSRQSRATLRLRPSRAEQAAAVAADPSLALDVIERPIATISGADWDHSPHATRFLRLADVVDHYEAGHIAAAAVDAREGPWVPRAPPEPGAALEWWQLWRWHEQGRSLWRSSAEHLDRSARIEVRGTMQDRIDQLEETRVLLRGVLGLESTPTEPLMVRMRAFRDDDEDPF